MAKIKLTKGELKRQRDALRQYHRYLPTLHLKKKQLQLEIHRQAEALSEKRAQEGSKRHDAAAWGALLSDASVDMRPWLSVRQVATGIRNIAGVDIPVCTGIEFDPAEYDLFMTPPWIDHALDALRAIAALREEARILEQGLTALQAELRTTSQRVNLFEKVKIPEAQEAIRCIKIAIGDQMTNAVGRSKIAKAKIDALELAGTVA